MAEKTALELTLLSPEYAMTFEGDILGDARWPTSTRLGHQTQSPQAAARRVLQERQAAEETQDALHTPAVAAAPGAPGDRQAVGRPQPDARRRVLRQARLEGCRPAVDARLRDAAPGIRICALGRVQTPLPPPRAIRQRQ